MIRNQAKHNRSYRPDIDGLRAIAVLLVVMFHLDAPLFQGGFIGVDVFFVISGFLITRLIYTQTQSGGFSLRIFYVRRIRRLLPALFVTLFVSFIAAYIVFSPVHLEHMSGSVIASALSVSNIYFWQKVSYFDVDVMFKPLLHTWSLSAEEQFYLVWPVFIYIALKLFGSKYTLCLVVAAFLGTLILTELFIERSVAVFFLTPFRIYEFALGAVMVWIPEKPKRGIIGEIITLTGFILILYASIVFDKDTVFPGINALIPCIGTACIIWGGQAEYAGRILRNRLSVFLGLISYAIYLVHWPLIVFYHYIVLRPLTVMETIFVLCATIAFAYAMYLFVEKPFRYGFDQNIKAKHVLCGAFSCIVVMCALAGYAVYKNGMPERFPENIHDFIKDTDRFSDASIAYDEKHNIDSFPKDSNKIKVLVIGDSHSRDIFNALHINNHLKPNTIFARLDSDEICFRYLSPQSLSRRNYLNRLLGRSDKCEKEAQTLKKSALVQDADQIFVVAKWHEQDVGGLYDLAAFVKESTSAELVMFGRTPDVFDVPSFIARHRDLGTLNTAITRTRNNHIAINHGIQNIASEVGALYIDRELILCPKVCSVVQGDHTLFVFDSDHWTVEGAAYFGNKFMKSEALRFLN